MTPEERFWAMVDKSEDCWEWTGQKMVKGYGRFHYEGRSQLAHRVSFEWFNRPLCDGETVDHLCANKSCVNPDHLDACSRIENFRRAWDSRPWPHYNSLKTHCKRGHEFTADNTRILAGNRRLCLECRALWVRGELTDLKRSA